MPRPILFSQHFPSYHPRAGQPTFFVEKIRNYLAENDDSFKGNLAAYLDQHIFVPEQLISSESVFSKSHTIRAGNRWKENVMLSPRVWSGAPYRSKQIKIGPDLPVRKVWEILILPSKEVFIHGQQYGFYGSPEIERLAHHDGLSQQDFEDWFCRLPFEGQIICWDPRIEY